MFFSVAIDDNALAVCKRIPRGRKAATSFNTTNLLSHLKGRHRGEGVLKEYEAVAAAATSAEVYKCLPHPHALKVE